MIKAALLYTGEHIIGNFKVTTNDNHNVGYTITNPYIIDSHEIETVEEAQLLQESDESQNNILVTNRVYFKKWVPFSADNFFIIDYEWVVTFYEPHEQIKKSYIEKFGE